MLSIQGRITFSPERVSVVASASRAEGKVILGLRYPDGRSPDGLWLELRLPDAMALWQELTHAIRLSLPQWDELHRMERQRESQPLSARLAGA